MKGGNRCDFCRSAYENAIKKIYSKGGETFHSACFIIVRDPTEGRKRLLETLADLDRWEDENPEWVFVNPY